MSIISSNLKETSPDPTERSRKKHWLNYVTDQKKEHQLLDI